MSTLLCERGSPLFSKLCFMLYVVPRRCVLHRL